MALYQTFNTYTHTRTHTHTHTHTHTLVLALTYYVGIIFLKVWTVTICFELEIMLSSIGVFLHNVQSYPCTPPLISNSAPPPLLRRQQCLPECGHRHLLRDISVGKEQFPRNITGVGVAHYCTRSCSENLMWIPWKHQKFQTDFLLVARKLLEPWTVILM